jgi:hypothetical protein
MNVNILAGFYIPTFIPGFRKWFFKCGGIYFYERFRVDRLLSIGNLQSIEKMGNRYVELIGN